MIHDENIPQASSAPPPPNKHPQPSGIIFTWRNEGEEMERATLVINPDIRISRE